MKGQLFLLPTVLADDTQKLVLPDSVLNRIGSLTHFLCENVRTARRFVSALKIHNSIEALQFEVLDKDTQAAELPRLFLPIDRGHDLGVLSESGCPGIADPGAAAVQYAHQNDIQVIPLVGPSSILLALMASGLNGQRFAFHGYLPVEAKAAIEAIKEFEQESKKKNQTQIFIETPYRTNTLLEHFLKSLRPDTSLCVASNLTSAHEKIVCRSVAEWKKHPIKFEKEPAVFLFLTRP